MGMMRGVWCAVGLVLAGVAVAVPGVNVRDFGAVGDGVADDTLAIQRAADALDAARDNGRKHMMVLCDRYRKSRMDGPVGEVFFPKGTYRTTGPVVFRGSTFVRGEKGTVVRNDNPQSVVFFFRKGYRADVRSPNVTIANLVSYNFTERPPVFVSKLDEGESWHRVDARVVNCFPFVK